MNICNEVGKFSLMKPAAFYMLSAFRMQREVSLQGCSAFEVELVLSNLSGDGCGDLHLRFTDVVDIKLGDIGSMCGVFVQIEDVGSRQLEGISFHVKDENNNAFSFSCRGFEATVQQT